MSVILEPRNPVALRERTAPRREPAVAPLPQRKPRTRVKKRGSRLAAAAAFIAKLGVATAVMYGGSLAVCQFAYEQARHAGNQAVAGARAAEGQMVSLRREVDLLQAAGRIETWAALNGFEPSYQAANEASR